MTVKIESYLDAWIVNESAVVDPELSQGFEMKNFSHKNLPFPYG